MFINPLPPALAGTGGLDQPHGAGKDHTILHCQDRGAPRYYATDAYTGAPLGIARDAPALDRLEIGDTLSLGGVDCGLIERRSIAHQGPVFVIGAAQAVIRAKAHHLLLHDALNGRDHDVDLGATSLATLKAGDRIKVDGQAHIVSARLIEPEGQAIFTVPHGPALQNWALCRAQILKFAPQPAARAVQSERVAA